MNPCSRDTITFPVIRTRLLSWIVQPDFCWLRCATTCSKRRWATATEAVLSPQARPILNRHCAIAPFDCPHGGVQGLQLQAQKKLDKTALEMGRQGTNARARGLLLHFIEDPSPSKFHARAMKPHGEIICQEFSQETKSQVGKPE